MSFVIMGDVMAHSITTPYLRPQIWNLNSSPWSTIVPTLGISRRPFKKLSKANYFVLFGVPFDLWFAFENRFGL